MQILVGEMHGRQGRKAFSVFDSENQPAAQGYVAASITAFPKQVGRSFLDDDEYSSHDWRGRGADR
jgi:hypothetical protein